MFSLQPSSGIPIYQQIVDQVRSQIASGGLAAGASLPSVRSIASNLGVNPMTVSKAYSILERGGVVVRQPGVGMLVSQNTQSPTDLLKPKAAELAESARALGMDQEQLLALVASQWKGEDA